MLVDIGRKQVQLASISEICTATRFASLDSMRSDPQSGRVKVTTGGASEINKIAASHPFTRQVFLIHPLLE